MSLALDILSGALLLGGSLFLIIGAVGLLRMPDFFTRLHPAGVTDTLAAGLILLGLACLGGGIIVVIKLVLILVFLLITSPTSSHATARAAIAFGLVPLQFGAPKDDSNKGS